MPLYLATLIPEAHWIVVDDDPPEFIFPADSPFFGWAIFHPLAIPKATTPILLPVDGPAVIHLHDGKCRFIQTRSLVVRSPIEDPHEAALRLEDVLAWVRFATGQSRLPVRIAGIQVIESASPAATINLRVGGPVLRYDLEQTAITFPRLAEQARAPDGFSIPVYAAVLLDAIEASTSSDEKKAILYCAIGVEAMATACLEAAFGRASTDDPARLRQVALPSSGGVAVQKDPVYDALAKSARREFKMLLHELPLYVLRKSLLCDDQGTYNDLVRLHETRNYLAHGRAAASSDALTIDLPGTRTALRAAITACNWFGARGKYVPFVLGDPRFAPELQPRQ